ncbi:MAG: FHA domain-containing protein [Rhodocyclaceae bacterium]|nr:FHA domain-containing protein [Rhodocyclaceae bacterium]
MPTLILSMDSLVLREVHLKEGRTRIGRAGDNTLQLDNPAVSQHHAAITVVGGDAFLEDCDSTNGTQLNQGNVRRAVLRNNDLITIGKYQLRYLSADPPDTLAPREPPRNPAATIHVNEPQPLPPPGELRLLTGARAGQAVPLVRPFLNIGTPEQQLTILRHGAEYLVTQTAGDTPVLLNGEPVGERPRPLAHRDTLEVAATRMVFLAPVAPKQE